MFGGIDAGLIMEVAKMGGYMKQLSLFESPPFIEVDLQFFTDVQVKYSWNCSDGYGLMRSIEHPTMMEVRNLLESKGYIERAPWSNGDTVLKPFYINRYLFDVEDRFVSAVALQYDMKEFMESDEYERRDPENFIYK